MKVTTNDDKNVGLSVLKTKEELTVSVGIRPGCPATSGRCWCRGRKREEREAKNSVRIETARVAGKFSLVAGKMSRVRNKPHFFKQTFERTYHFLPIQPCYSSGIGDGNQEKLITASDQSSLLWVAVPQFGDNIQLEAFYKLSWMVRGSVEKGHLF